jgi:NADH-quinone oxidoreductase subunit J
MNLLAAVDLPDIPGAPVEVLLFAGLALLAVLGAVLVISATDPFISALSLLLNFGSLGAMYLMLTSPFVAIAQVIVYAGAVVVLFLFVIAYLGDRREVLGAARRAQWVPPVALVAGLAMAGLLVGVAVSAHYPEPARLTATSAGFAYGSAHAVGQFFLTDYVLEFEITSLVLLVAAIGGIVLGLTGRGRHNRLREQMGTESADEFKRTMRDRRRSARAARDAATLASRTDGGPTVGASTGGDS